MQYRCTSCKETFEVPAGDKPRCPKCLRIHNVEAVGARKKDMSRYRGPAIFFGIIAVALGAYVIWYLSQGEDEPEEVPAVEVGPLSADELRDHLKRRGAKRSELLIPFEESPEIEAFAQKAVHGKASRQEKAEALLDAIRERVTDGHEHYVSISPRGTPLRTPTETLAALKSDEPFEPYAYELAALMIAAARSVGVPAVMAEVYQYEAAKRPTDPSGVMGYYVAALPRGESDNYRRPVLYDPATGRYGDSAEGDMVVLNDMEAVSAALTLKALYLAGYQGDTPRAERLSSLAVDLRSGSPTALAARGTVRLQGGGGELSARAALEEYERALRIRPDAQRKMLVARILLATNQPSRAEELVRSALNDAEEFAAAHGILGLIHLANERTEEAQAALTTAEQLEPRDPQMALLWVQYHLSQQNLAAAREAAQAVVDRVPNDPQPRLLLAQILYRDARYGAAEAQFRELIRRNPDNAQLRALLREMFEYDPDPSELEGDAGPTAVAAAPEEVGDAGAESGDGGYESGRYQLKMGPGLGKVRLGGTGGFQLDVPEM